VGLLPLRRSSRGWGTAQSACTGCSLRDHGLDENTETDKRNEERRGTGSALHVLARERGSPLSAVDNLTGELTMRVKGKVAIITGAKSGTGFASATRFAAEGAKVVAAHIRDASQEVGEIASSGTEILFVQVDVSDPSRVTAMIQETVSVYGRLDALVNNAGIELAKTVTNTAEKVGAPDGRQPEGGLLVL
jgi:hypothetical protein